ncbi:glycosyltransferase family 2 protein [Bacteroides caecigallinarum]|nr:glycosyltransferase family 2 protein [Bacteroides caecigallinarum]
MVAISILVPVYNVEKYLERCIESILSQDFYDYEIILVDDGSPDNSGKICDEFRLKYPERIRVIHNP